MRTMPMRSMAMRMMTVLAAVLALHARAAGQSSHTHSEMIDDDRRITVDARGQVRFTDDDQGVAWMEPGARMSVEESNRGEPERRVVWREEGGRVRRTFYLDGRETAPDAGDEAWIRRALLQPIRESGAYATQRVTRIHRRGGTDAVLDEIRQIAGDGAKRAYYTALLRLPAVRGDDAARVLLHAGRGIASDGDKRTVLTTGLERFRGDRQVTEAAVRAAARIASDGDKSSVLRSATEGGALRDPAVREAFMQTARGIASDGDKSSVLIAAMASEGSAATAASALRVARTIASDGDKTRVLTSTSPSVLRNGEVRSAFSAALQTIASDGDRSRAATWLARSLP
ncbi:MAG TPA: hypothetical protein VFJ16_26595 [Longimicrobium sp.]|nr:hypothetical protein [Longimicrobium sp.]